MRPLLPSRRNRCAAGTSLPTDCVSGAVKSWNADRTRPGPPSARKPTSTSASAPEPTAQRALGLGARTGAAMSRRSSRSNAARSAAAITAKATSTTAIRWPSASACALGLAVLRSFDAECDEGGRADGGASVAMAAGVARERIVTMTIRKPRMLTATAPRETVKTRVATANGVIAAARTRTHSRSVALEVRLAIHTRASAAIRPVAFQ